MADPIQPTGDIPSDVVEQIASALARVLVASIRRGREAGARRAA